MKKILVLYTSVGLGHKYIAENIGFHLAQDGYDVKLHDILQLQQGKLVNTGTWLHSVVNRKLPFIWRWLYFSELVNWIGCKLRIPLAKKNSEHISEVVDQFEPDMILTTQTTASAAVSALKLQGKFHGKFVVAFSDYHLHKMWLYGNEPDLYLANIPEQKAEMVKLGIGSNKIAVCGITLQPFEEADQDQLRTDLGIPAGNKVILVGSGSLGIGFPKQLLKDFVTALGEQRNTSTIVLCGKNNELKQELDELQASNLLALPFTDKLKQIYQITDLFITKPGGLTMAEVFQAGTKILITHTLPGQEEPNYDYLLNKGLISPMPDPLNLDNLLDATQKAMGKQSPHETPEIRLITQKGAEGEIVKSAINKLFSLV